MSSIAGPPEPRKIAHVELRFVLNRPRSSQNIGAAARALANTSAGVLWGGEPLGFDRAQAAKLAAGAGAVLGGVRGGRTLGEGLDGRVGVGVATGRPRHRPPLP